MAIALIFAGGAGKRMNSAATPKQFLPMHGKPVIVYTLEHFQDHEEIEGIVIVCIKEWVSKLCRMAERYGIDKIRGIVPGGGTGHDSIYLGLEYMKSFAKEKDIVLIHDGVRPLITEEVITANIRAVEEFGSAITCESVKESVVESPEEKVVLGNLNAKRDWGYAGDYVEGMWRMLQQEKPDDYVLATNETHTVREFVELAFREIGEEICWEGEGVNEKGYDRKSGKLRVEVDERFFRPAEVDLLWGDSSKAERELGWKRKVSFPELVRMMVKADLERLNGNEK